MNQHSIESVERTLRRPLWVALAAGVLLVAGCGPDDRVDQALKQAEVKLNAVSLGGSSALPSVGRRKGMYEEVLKILNGIGEDVGSGQAAAASLMQARAHAGLAEIQAGAAAESESAFQADLIAARSVLDKWVSQNATADALDIYDPTKDLANLDRQIETKQREAQEAMAQKEAQERAVADLRARAAEIQAQAKVVREQESGLREQSRGVAATSRAALIEQSALRRREADALEMQSSELLAKASVEAPKIAELERQAGRLKTQQDLLRQAQVDIRARADAGKEHAAKAREDAKGAGTKFAELLTALGTAREALSAPSDAAARGFQTAVGAAKKAGTAAREGKAAANVAAGSFQQSLGDVIAARARGQMSYAALVRAAAEAKPSLAGASVWRDKAKAAEEQASALTKDAVAAYESAKSLFESAGAGDKVKGVTDALTRLLEEKQKASLDPKAVEGEVRGALEMILKAQTPEESMSHIVFKNEETKKAVEGLMPSVSKLTALRTAAKAKFGKDIADLIKSSANPAIKGNPLLAGLAGGGAGGGVPGLPAGDAAAAKIEVQGPSKATVTMGSGAPIEMMKADGVWKMHVELPAAALGQVKMMAPMMATLGASLDEVTGKINDGGYPASDDMLQDLVQRVMASMTGGGAPGQGGEKKP